jgi:hypothetical protein
MNRVASIVAMAAALFERTALQSRLRELGARVEQAGDGPDVVRFSDNNGIAVEVRP